MDHFRFVSDVADRVAVPTPEFMTRGFEPLEELKDRFSELQETLADIACIGGENGAKKLKRMSQELDSFAPEVTFIGQIKSGKTSLVNAMAARPGLLPSDVNPWTSVVTSLHLNKHRGDKKPTAEFKFFDADEWDNLVQHGGRIGELSARTGADKEQEKLIQQISEMRDMTKARLGKKFELLLGQTHHYESFNADLVKRYVCLGDNFGVHDTEDKQGQFADITKTADLYLDAPGLPTGLTLRDTPGLNDTFMMREQITIRAIRDSQLCVVVLSAHQALNAVDMGLIRLISSVKSRQVVIFVNRVDELSDPAAQIPEIRDSLLQTLKDHNGPEDPEILFGSALWANAVLTGTVSDLPEASIDALEGFVQGYQIDGVLPNDDEDATVWVASGLPALFRTLNERIKQASGTKLMSSVRKRASNMVLGLRASSTVVSLSANSDEIQKMSDPDVVELIAKIEESGRRKFNTALDKFVENFGTRIDQANGRFVSRAVDALIKHLDEHGEKETWNYSPDGLRVLVRSAYQVMGSRLRKDISTVLKETANDLTTAYGQIFDVVFENFSVETPSLPDLPPPVSIAQTIILDVKTSWWKSWSRKRKGFTAFASDFRELIAAETAPIVGDLKTDQIDEIRVLMTEVFDNFIAEQQSVLADILEKSKISLSDLHGLFGVTSQEEREQLFDILFEELEIDQDEIGEAA